MTEVRALAPHVERVLDEWIDYNGHLGEAYYVLVFGFATDAVMEQLGLDHSYRSASGCSLFTLEAHVRYLDQVPPHVELRVETTVIGGDHKRLRLWHEMYVDDVLRATEEIMGIHVDVTAGRAKEFPPDIASRIEALRVQPPEAAGRAIGL